MPASLLSSGGCCGVIVFYGFFQGLWRAPRRDYRHTGAAIRRRQYGAASLPVPAQAYAGGDGAFAARYASVYRFVYKRYFAAALHRERA